MADKPKRIQRISPRAFKHITRLIRREVSYFNGWWVSDENVDKACEKAAQKVLRYLVSERSTR